MERALERAELVRAERARGLHAQDEAALGTARALRAALTRDVCRFGRPRREGPVPRDDDEDVREVFGRRGVQRLCVSLPPRPCSVTHQRLDPLSDPCVALVLRHVDALHLKTREGVAGALEPLSQLREPEGREGRGRASVEVHGGLRRSRCAAR